MKIAVDAMGGDHAPREVVRGAVKAAREFDLSIVLVGREDTVRAELASSDPPPGRVEVVHASEVVEMCDAPGVAFRKKKDSSIAGGAEPRGRGEGLVLHERRKLGGGDGGSPTRPPEDPRDRPAGDHRDHPDPHGADRPDRRRANVDCKPAHLYQFGIMGEAYARKILGIERPRVGLVSIGQEESKGTDLTRDTAALFREDATSAYVGNVEGRDFFADKADVFVCDGFVGNVALKTMEGMATALGHFLKEEILKSWAAKLGAVFAGGAIRRVRKKLDYAEYGGAPLLG